MLQARSGVFYAKNKVNSESSTNRIYVHQFWLLLQVKELYRHQNCTFSKPLNSGTGKVATQNPDHFVGPLRELTGHCVEQDASRCILRPWGQLPGPHVGGAGG